MGRRARQLLVFLEDLDERKIDYISVRDGHLTGDSASAKIFRHMLVGMAEYESNLISERTRAGLAAKKARGETWGGRKKGQRYRLTPEKLQAVKGLLAEGLSKAEIARQLRIARSKHGLRSDHASCLICPLPAGNAPHKCRRESSWKQRWRGLSVGRLMFPLQSSFAHSR